MPHTLLLIVQNGFILLFCLAYAVFFALKKNPNPSAYFAQICFLTLYLAPLVMLILQVCNAFDGEIQDNYLLATSVISPILSTILYQFGVRSDGYFIADKKQTSTL